LRSGADDTARLTHALRHPSTAAAAARALGLAADRAAVEALAEVVEDPPSAAAGVAAIAALDPVDEPIVRGALVRALDVPFGPVRLAAIGALRRRGAAPARGALVRVLREDPFWTARRAALHALAELPDPDDLPVFEAASDLHWRVRHALIQVLLPRGTTLEGRLRIEEQLATRAGDARARGVRDYLRFRWSGTADLSDPEPQPPLDPRSWCPFWDWDPAVLARELDRLRPGGRRRALDAMPRLLGHDDERVRRWAFEALRESGEPRHLAEALRLLDEPRHEAAGSAARLLQDLEPDLDRSEALALFLLAMPQPSAAQLAWALRQVGPDGAVEEVPESLAGLMRQAAGQPAEVRRALAGLAARWQHPERDGWIGRFLDDPNPRVSLEALRGLNEAGETVWSDTLDRLLDVDEPALRAEAAAAATRSGIDRDRAERLADDPDPRVRACLAEALAARPTDSERSALGRLLHDDHPRVRAAALTADRARELVEDPSRETSWTVLERAARLRRVPFARLEPRPPWQPDPAPPSDEAPMTLAPGPTPHARPLGRGGPLVAPVGISGHYGLPVEGFARAFEAGVNLMFWEPNYETMTRFMTRLSPSGRAEIHLVAGTFEADGVRVSRDAERALRSLGAERLAVFLLFWVRSWARVSDDVLAALEDLRDAGKIASFGLSTHARGLAVEALERGWETVMVRHSAAHRKAEAEVFPRAVALGSSLLTFNATCYGRLLAPSPGADPPPRAADCYRYSLAQPGVAACLSAPATLDELDENLGALRQPELPAERAAALRARGDLVFREDTVFRALVRQV
jgi:HEAT repeat protein